MVFLSYVPGRSVVITEGWEKKGPEDGKGKREKKRMREAKGRSVWSYLVAVAGSMSRGGRPQLEHRKKRRESRERGSNARCNGCDLNRACKSPFPDTQHARQQKQRRRHRLSRAD